MVAFRAEVITEADGSVIVHHLPLSPGELVEVIVLVQERKAATAKRYPLHRQNIVYHEPFAAAALDDWRTDDDHS